MSFITGILLKARLHHRRLIIEFQRNGNILANFGYFSFCCCRTKSIPVFAFLSPGLPFCQHSRGCQSCRCCRRCMSWHLYLGLQILNIKSGRPMRWDKNWKWSSFRLGERERRKKPQQQREREDFPPANISFLSKQCCHFPTRKFKPAGNENLIWKKMPKEPWSSG